MIFGWFGKRNKSLPKKSASRKYTLPFDTDLHSHIIPGIDDGSKSMEESIHLIEEMIKLGYKKFIITPHVMTDTYRNTTDQIKKGLEELQNELQRREIKVELSASAEYYMDSELTERLQKRDILPIPGNYLLFETSYYAEPINLKEVIYEIGANGYQPLLAHPERYRYAKDFDEFYGSLKEIGCMFQTNINSLGGYYGQDAKKKAEWLSAQGWIDFLGSDLHGEKHVVYLQKTIESGAISRVLENNTIKNDRLFSTELSEH